VQKVVAGRGIERLRGGGIGERGEKENVGGWNRVERRRDARRWSDDRSEEGRGGYRGGNSKEKEGGGKRLKIDRSEERK